MVPHMEGSPSLALSSWHCPELGWSSLSTLSWVGSEKKKFWIHFYQVPLSHCPDTAPALLQPRQPGHEALIYL